MLTRFPPPRDLVPVYAVILAMFSGWTILAFLWKLPSWLMVLTIGELMTVFSYSMLTNLLESLTVFVTLLLICVLLPRHVLRDDFIVRGTILSVGMIGSLMAFLGSYRQLGMEKESYLLAGPLLMLLLTAFLLGYSKLGPIRSAALWISDRLIVFLYILAPLTFLLSPYVTFRLIL